MMPQGITHLETVNILDIDIDNLLPIDYYISLSISTQLSSQDHNTGPEGFSLS